MKKKILSLLLCIVLCLSLMPMRVFAEESFEFRKLPTTGVTTITVPEGDWDTEVAAKDAFILFWGENIKTKGEFVLVDCIEDGSYHMWIINTENDNIAAYPGGYDTSLESLLWAVENTSEYYDWWVNGTYTAIHTHAFTYTANNGKVTATCVDGCDDDYDTNPLTLTLTAPASLVYNRNAKAFTFADGEAAAWTGAGLELPTITYAAKSGSSLTSDKAVDAGSYTASVTVDTDKTASLDFEITKATPYIKTNPEPTEIELGKKLADSTLVDGYVYISSSDSTEVAGLFEWTNPDTVPGIDDSEVTLYDVTFTPVDTNNYNTASCQVKITVNHTAHNPVLVNGQAPTQTESGWKDYYECVCGKLFEDVNGTIPIDNLETWKAEGGNGYIAPLIHYEITDGAKAVININEGKNVLFTSTAPYNKFYTLDGGIAGKVLVDDKLVDPSNYTHAEGSTKVTMKASYLSTLAEGTHTLTIVSTDGQASITFTITKGSKPAPSPYIVPNTSVVG